jgi:hypothetical protein
VAYPVVLAVASRRLPPQSSAACRPLDATLRITIFFFYLFFCVFRFILIFVLPFICRHAGDKKQCLFPSWRIRYPLSAQQ